MRSRQEENYVKAAQKILASQVKQAMLSAQLTATNSDQQSFSSSSAIAMQSSLAPSANFVAQNLASGSDNADDVEWEDGYFGIKPGKPVDDDSDNVDDTESLVWDLPEDADDISIDVLSHLPCDVRKSIVEDARRQLRHKKRSFYMPVAKNPALYSQTQLANFLKTR
jgi:hypothetical protein